MRVEQQQWIGGEGWTGPSALSSAQLVCVFGAGRLLQDRRATSHLRTMYPEAALFGCSTAGEITGTTVVDDSLVATALHFAHTSVRMTSATVGGDVDSRAAGAALAHAVRGDDLRHVLVLSDGLGVNGSQLVEGLAGGLPSDVVVTGGLAGDGTRFAETFVLSGDIARSNVVAAVGLYGSRIRVGCASLGGWDPFGPERVVTRSRGNVLYELDGHSALELYKRYLGDHAHELPSSGLLFPLTIWSDGDAEPIVRTILAVDESDGSMTFAGDVPQGSRGRLMKANFDRLIDGASGAAGVCRAAAADSPADFALLISCVGRKLVLKQRTEEEVEAVRGVLGPQATLAGFYSYGEISPFTTSAPCRLHNQTMTITTLAEV